MNKKLKEKLANEQSKFNGCYRNAEGKMVKGKVADKNGWRVQENGKNKPTIAYWIHRLTCLAITLELDEETTSEALDQFKKSHAKAEAKALKEESRKLKALEREIKKEQALKEKEEKQKALEALRSKLRKQGVEEEDLPKRVNNYGEHNGLQCPYALNRRSGYLYIWLVLSETPDEWVSWDKLETEALARFTEAHPDYIAKHYGEGNEYDIRRQVGVMDRSPYNKPLELIGQRVIKSPSKGVKLISDTKGESYEDYKARKRGKKVEAQLPPVATAPVEETQEEKVNA